MVNAYTKIVTPAQAEANRANGRKGGRPKGKIPPQEADAQMPARPWQKTLQERCQQNELQHVETLESIAGDATQPASARIAAISLLFDRGRGKAVQSEHHSGGVSFTVLTGVPEPDPGDPEPKPRVPHSPKPWPITSMSLQLCHQSPSRDD